MTWTYDADGRRTSMTMPDGSTARYGWDAAGRLSWIDHSSLGRAAFDRDAAGRLVSAVAGGLIQSWEHRDGFVVAHTITDGEGATRTAIDRDEQGRVQRITKGDGLGAGLEGSVTEYDYDGACQLAWSRTRAGIGAATGRWAYDGDRVRRITLKADALGELASVDGTEFFWDSASYAVAPVARDPCRRPGPPVRRRTGSRRSARGY